MTNVSTLLLGLGAGVELIDEQIFTTSGTWTKPAFASPDDMAEVIVWGAGGTTWPSLGESAGGGACHRRFVRVRDLAASVAAVVGVAPEPVGSGGAGGMSSFGKIRAFGGAGGSNAFNGGGGGIHGAGSNGSSGSFGRGGGPQGGTDTLPPGDYGGGAAEAGFNRDAGEYGGAAGGGDAIWGGAGGLGVSVFGGDGATNSVPAQAPGGGGFGSSSNVAHRVGARGEVRVRIWRGI